MSFFMNPSSSKSPSAKDLAAELATVSTKVRRFATVNRLNKVERESMKLVESALHRGAILVKAIQLKAPR